MKPSPTRACGIHTLAAGEGPAATVGPAALSLLCEVLKTLLLYKYKLVFCKLWIYGNQPKLALWF